MSMRLDSKTIKKWLIIGWLLIPVGLLSYHYGPGQRELAWRDAAASHAEAVEHEKNQHWEQAIAAYGQSLSAVPTTSDNASAAAQTRDQLRLAQLRAAFQLGKLGDTLTDTRQFVEHVEATHGAQSQLAYDARDFLGRVHYQAMIALRLESAEEQVWRKHWELSRQNFRFLAEHSLASRNKLDRENLEIVIKSANLPPPPPPPASSSASSATTTTFTPPTQTPPPPTGGAATAPPADNRPRAPEQKTKEVVPPEFEKGS